MISMPLLSRAPTSAYAASSVWTDYQYTMGYQDACILCRFVRQRQDLAVNGFVMSITWTESIDGDVTNAYVASSTCKAAT